MAIVVAAALAHPPRLQLLIHLAPLPLHLLAHHPPILVAQHLLDLLERLLVRLMVLHLSLLKS